MAIAGVSRDPKKFGGAVYKHLTDNDFTVFPVNPNTEMIGESKCYPDVASLPDEVDRLYIVTPKQETRSLLEEAINKGIRKIWIQQMSHTQEALSLAREHNLEMITKECIFMFAEPVTGPHKFHRFIRKMFGQYPR